MSKIKLSRLTKILHIIKNKYYKEKNKKKKKKKKKKLKGELVDQKLEQKQLMWNKVTLN